MTDRLFFALWPDDDLRAELAGRVAEWTRGYPCKPQRPDQWHLTVEFLGNVPMDRQPALHDCGSALEGCLDAPDTVVLDRLEHWKRPEVLCVAAQAVSPALAGLVAALKSELAQRGFEPEIREFRPHLTLARKARLALADRPVEPIRWPVRFLTLVRSVSEVSGSRYEPLMRWNLISKPGPGLAKLAK